MQMPSVFIRLCPDLQLIREGAEPFFPPPGKNGLLLLRLALTRKRLLSRDEIVRFLWPAADPTMGRARLRVALSALKTEFQLGDCIISNKLELGLDWSNVDTDFEQFRRSIQHLEGITDPRDHARRIIESTGELEGVLGSQYSHPWLDEVRNDLLEQKVNALRRAAQLLITAQDLNGAESALRGALTLDRYREVTQIDFANLLVKLGRVADLTAFYEQLRKGTMREYGMEPSGQLRRIVREAQHASKGVSESHQPVLEDLPRSPDVVISLIGRNKDLESVHQLASRHRVVILTGPGGVGKTSLAHALIWLMSSTVPDGTHRVQLSGVPVGGEILTTVLRVLNLDGPGLSDPLKVISDRLGQGRQILYLDTCEHVSNRVFRLINDLLARVPGLTIIATSRESLHISGSAEFRVKPLDIPAQVGNEDLDQLMECAGVRLFVTRVQDYDPEYELTLGDAPHVAEIVRRVEGIPLALELAASRTKSLTVKEIAVRLHRNFELLRQSGGHVDERQRTLFNTIEWSFGLLSPTEQEVLCRLSLITHRWTLDEAERLCPPEQNTYEAVTQLLDKSLIIRARIDGRYTFSMFDSVREFSRDKLGIAPYSYDAASRFVGYARTSLTAEQLQWATHPDGFLDYLEPRLNTWLSALTQSFAIEEDFPLASIDILLCLMKYWLTRGSTSQGLEMFHRLRDRLGPTIDRAEMFPVLKFGFYLTLWQHDGKEGERIAKLHQRVARELGDEVQLRYATHNVARALQLAGEFDEAVRCLDDLIPQFFAAGEWFYLILARTYKCEIARERNDRVEGRKAFEELYECYQTYGRNLKGETTTQLIASCAFWIEPDPKVGAELLLVAVMDPRTRLNERTLAFRSIIVAVLAIRVGFFPLAAQIYGAFRKFCSDAGVTNLNPMDEATCVRELSVQLSDFEREVNYRIGEGMTKGEIGELCISICRTVLNLDEKA